MLGSFRQRGCKCPPGRKRCTCGAKWYYRYDITDPVTGKRKQKEIGGFRTKKEAEEAAKKIQYELQAGTYIEEKNITFEQFAKEWLDGYAAKVKVSTVRLRKCEINRLMGYFRHLKMKNITRKQYQDVLYDLKKKGLADKTIVGTHRAGRMIFKKAIELEVIKKDPTEFAFVPKTKKTIDELEQEEGIPKYLEKEELVRFLSVIPDHGMDVRDYPIFLTLAYTGMRVGELCALKWSDVDFDEQTIDITKTYYNPNNSIKEYTLLPPKTKRSKRIINVEQTILDELLKLKKAQTEVRMRYRSTYYDKGFVFAQMDKENAGYPIYPKLIGTRMKRLLKISGLNQSLSPHSLRHTHTSLLAEAGVSLEQIMDRLGHSNDETTRNIYLHITKPKKKEASHKFGQLMQGLL